MSLTIRRRRPAPWRRLAPLAVIVLAAHLVLLRAVPDALVQPGKSEVRSFSTRTIVPAAPPPAAAAAGPRPATARPAARARRTDTAQPPANAPTLAAAPEPAPAEEGPARIPSDLDSGGAALRAAPPTTAGPEPAVQPPPAAQVQGAPPVVALPMPARMRYEVVASRFGVTLHGEADLHWRHDGSQYEARLEVRSSLFPTRIERSTGRVTADGLAPDYYWQKGRNEQATHFQRDQGRLTFSNNSPPAPLLPGTQDRLSVVVQLATLIGGQPDRYPPGTRIVIPTTGTREAEPWVFAVEGEEELQLPGGAVRALKLQRRPRKEYDQQVEVWLAPRMDYAPVRLRLTNPNGDTVDQRWSSTDKG